MSSTAPLRFTSIVLALAAALVPSAACDDGGTDRTGGGADEGGIPGAPADASVDGASRTSGATMRLANLAPDLGPVDFCYQVARTSAPPIGPVLGGGAGAVPTDAGTDATGDAVDAGADAAPDAGVSDAGASDAGVPSVAYRSVSRYLVLRTSGPLRIGLVPAGSRSCANPLMSADVTLDPGKLITVVAMGRRDEDASPRALALVAFTDERDTVADKARVRVIHADRGGAPVAVSATAAETVTLADRVEPGHASSASAVVPVDTLGYATVRPVPPPASIAVGPVAGAGPDATAPAWQSAGANLGLRGGSLHTAFILPGTQAAYEVLWCTDTSTASGQTLCERLR